MVPRATVLTLAYTRQKYVANGELRFSLGLPKKQSGVRFSRTSLWHQESSDFPQIICGDFKTVNQRVPASVRTMFQLTSSDVPLRSIPLVLGTTQLQD